MKKKVITLLVALLAIASGAWADDGVWVKLKDGSRQGFLFECSPTITYVGDNLVMNAGGASATYAIDNIEEIYFDDVPENATDITSTDVADKVIRATRNGARLTGFAAGTVVTVYDLGGRLLQQLQVGQDGTLSVDLTSQPKGTYVIKAEKSTLKIQTK